MLNFGGFLRKVYSIASIGTYTPLDEFVKKPPWLKRKWYRAQAVKLNVMGDGVLRVDWRALERNKYAPWGRGWLGGAPVKKLVNN